MEAKVISLFSGCGGLDLGFEGGFSVFRDSINLKINPHWNVQDENKSFVKLPKTMFKTVFANDIKPEAKRAWDNFFSSQDLSASVYQVASIVDLVLLHQEKSGGVFPQEVDVLTGGFPCQDFSIAGKRKGFSSHKAHNNTKVTPDNPTIENRGQLYMWLREVVAITKPKLFIAENVKGLVNLDNVKEIIERDFSTVCDNGYLIIPAILLHAADFGVPQNRERIIFYGFKKSALTARALRELSQKNIAEEYSPYPRITHKNSIAVLGTDILKPYVTVRQALEGLEEPEKSTDLAQKHYSKAKFMGKHCQGQTEVNLDGIGPTIRAEHHGNIEFRRLSLDNSGKYIEELHQGLPERRLTVRECARIQTFPDDYEFVLPSKNGQKSVSASAAYKIIGNAVPPLLGFHIAKKLEDNWEKYFIKS